MIDLKGRVALITGGSRGIGRATAILFAKANADVAITYRSNDSAANLVVEEIKNMGRKAIALKGDVSKSSDVKMIVKEVLNYFGKIDILVNNAGIWTYGAIGEMPEEIWDETMNVNLKGVYLITNEVVPIMKKQRWGRIINISSTAGQRGEAFHSHYAASKGAIIAFTKSLAVELAKFNILVNCVAPGWVNTDMCAEVFKDPAFVEQVKSTIPLGRIPEPEEIAGPILFLASDLANWITGATISVNGGSVLCG
ncbi:3-oxoacyl-[acyl-carrier protein] reductase [Candidatus Kryptobacter tengchongensis]|uniref:3-oxoacyl-[acyl-carrier protein] reductase n=1 Tax=Kryptobacter tengchongensis TaxID=1643429 RepID=A0A656D899_KRYT1|nr:3-oxoacyl-ACP reductase family protein [Candidatus Kryptobacter tengchongensis]CUT02989.1 3-oxoacyl-[acyl-carrier protein] reductase [Candidatus Kryptobacter tengchongensis]CUU00828.1 3-oxoacyl-[acyl-carrier protein] reductase [Candidatus Kryptobacter tengchongensis]CUU06869.1 3-oxoacyl-[acyl-carrier protein] reductase [Candidatus Kryptobacter tengchongensis]